MTRKHTPIPPGTRFGRLTVDALSEDENKRGVHYRCKCDCGTYTTKRAFHLRKGAVKSCGCLLEEVHAARRAKPPSLSIGSTFGRLTVTGVHKRDRQGLYHYHCQCECGKTTSARANNLTDGNTSSCGCARGRRGTNPRRGSADSAIDYIIIAYKRSALQHGRAWALTREQVVVLIAATCHYCGMPPATVKPTRQGPFLWNGIDRLHNDQGYTPENSVTCCRTCNVAKNIMSIEVFAQWVQLLASRVQHWHPKLPLPQEVA
jgi:predicted SprT family Zn-dependent metalloprotease